MVEKGVMGALVRMLVFIDCKRAVHRFIKAVRATTWRNVDVGIIQILKRLVEPRSAIDLEINRVMMNFMIGRWGNLLVLCFLR